MTSWSHSGWSETAGYTLTLANQANARCEVALKSRGRKLRPPSCAAPQRDCGLEGSHFGMVERPKPARPSLGPTGDQQALRPEVFWSAAVPAVLDGSGVSASPSVGTAFSTMCPR
jgi:hypothetical protein